MTLDFVKDLLWWLLMSIREIVCLLKHFWERVVLEEVLTCLGINRHKNTILIKLSDSIYSRLLAFVGIFSSSNRFVISLLLFLLLLELVSLSTLILVVVIVLTIIVLTIIVLTIIVSLTLFALVSVSIILWRRLVLKPIRARSGGIMV